MLMFQNAGGVITQTTVLLPSGVPSDMVFASDDDGHANDFDSDILIAVPETPYVYVFNNLSSPSAPGAVTFSDIAFHEVGFGVRTAAIGQVDDTIGQDLILGTDAGDVILYSQPNQ